MSLEQKIVDQHAEWMRENAEGLRLLDNTVHLSPEQYAADDLREQTIRWLGSQIAVDAFRNNLAVIALSPTLYLVQDDLGVQRDASEPVGWLPTPPPANAFKADSQILIKIEGYGFPICPREV